MNFHDTAWLGTWAPLASAPLLGAGSSFVTQIAAVVIAIFFVAIVIIVIATYGNLWFQAYMSGAQVSLLRLIGMSFRQVNARVIVQSKIMAMQAGVANDPSTGITTQRLEAHYLAGGNVPGVIRAIIAAHRADIDLDFDRAAAIDLAGRDVLDAVQDQRLSQSDRLPRSAKIEKSRRSAPSPATASSCRFGPA